MRRTSAQIPFHHCPSCVYTLCRPLQPLHDEALAPEKTDAEASLKRDPDADPLGGAEERFLLGDQLPAQISQPVSG